MEEDYEEEAQLQLSKPRGRHIKKRALKNKALSVSFNEKDLRDYVTGFHKRKKKRRKEAHKKQEEAERRKRIEQRKKRKLEKEIALYGGTLASTGTGSDEIENDDNNEEDKEREPTASVSGTTMYDSGNMTVTVTTSEISREEEDLTGEKTDSTTVRSMGDAVDRKHNLPVSKTKPFKKVGRHRARAPSKRDRNKGKKRNMKIRY